MYIHRFLESKISRLGGKFKGILLLGARQIGKTTLLRHLLPKAQYVVFDPVQNLYNARQDPDLFLQTHPTPLILDEVQFVPELLATLKRVMDESSEYGQYYLTGSQNFSVLKPACESLAGRVAIIELDPLGIFEQHGIALQDTWVNKLIFENYPLNGGQFSLIDTPLLPSIWRGGFPGTLGFDEQDYPDFFRSYLQTYVERDVRLLANIKDLTQFSSFVALQATLTGHEVNSAHLGREIGVTPQTAKDWSEILCNSYQLFKIPAYSGNLIKRLSGKPKAYFVDTGFACYLMRINSPQALLGHPSFGHLFETFGVNQIIRVLKALGKNYSLHHWRTNGGAEVDLLIEIDGVFYPIEFKAKTNPTKRDLRGITQFRQDYPGLKIGRGFIVHAGDKVYPLTETDIAVPLGMSLK